MNPIKIFSKGNYVGPDIETLNRQAQQAIIYIARMYSQAQFKSIKDIFDYNNTEIYITSMDRGDAPHKNGMACDLKCEPVWMDIYLADIIQNSDNTSYVSTYNHHVHYEQTPGRGKKGAEILIRNGKEYRGLTSTSYKQGDKIKIGSFSGELFYVMAFCGLPPVRKIEFVKAPAFSLSQVATLRMCKYFERSLSDYVDFYNEKWPDMLKLTSDEIKNLIPDLTRYIIIGGIVITGIVLAPHLIKGIKNEKNS